MEPEQKYYKSFIEPLLNEPGTAFRHTTLSGAHPRHYFASYEKIFNSDDLLFKKAPLPPGDPKLRKLNKSLLVTGTVSRRYRGRAHVNNVHNANLLLNHMVQASQTNSLFHGYGLVRMLFWHPEDTRSTVLPDMVAARGGYSATQDVAADLVMVAGKDTHSLSNTDSENPKRLLAKWRWGGLDQIRADGVLEEMEKTGMHMPAHRQTTVYKAAVERKARTTEEKEEEAQCFNPIQTLADESSLDEAMTAHEEKVKSFHALQTVKTKGVGMGKRGFLDVPYKFKFPDAALRVFTTADLTRLGPYMDLWGNQITLEAAYASRKSTYTTEVCVQIEQRLRKVAGQLQATFVDKNMIAKQSRTPVQSLQNEIIAFNGKVLPYDRRPYEALTTDVEEFWPQFGMYLLDIQPRAENLAADYVSAVEANELMRQLITTLWQLSASAVPMAIDRIGPGAANDLLPQVPELTDASKGGRLDAEDMTVRTLTRDMLQSLTSAYLEWPFRPANLTGLVDDQ